MQTECFVIIFTHLCDISVRTCLIPCLTPNIPPMLAFYIDCFAWYCATTRTKWLFLHDCVGAVNVDSPTEDYYLLSDALREDAALRERLHLQRLVCMSSGIITRPHLIWGGCLLEGSLSNQASLCDLCNYKNSKGMGALSFRYFCSVKHKEHVWLDRPARVAHALLAREIKWWSIIILNPLL